MSRPTQPPTSRRDRRADERRRQQQLVRAGSSRRASKRPAWQSPFALVSIGAVAVAVVLIVFFAAKPPDPGAGLVTPNTDWSSAQVNGTTAGASDAKVVLEVYSDFQCPYCGEFAKQYLPLLVRDYVNTGSVKVVAHDIAIVGGGISSESAGAGAAAACASEQGRYWQFHDMLFWNQAGENLGAFKDDRLTAMAEKLGLDMTSWKACFADSSHRQAVLDETAVAKKLNITSTPTLVLNGTLIPGLPNTYATLSGYITSILTASPAPSGSPSASATPAPSGSTAP